MTPTRSFFETIFDSVEGTRLKSLAVFRQVSRRSACAMSIYRWRSNFSLKTEFTRNSKLESQTKKVKLCRQAEVQNWGSESWVSGRESEVMRTIGEPRWRVLKKRFRNLISKSIRIDFQHQVSSSLQPSALFNRLINHFSIVNRSLCDAVTHRRWISPSLECKPDSQNPRENSFYTKHLNPTCCTIV